MRGPKCHSTRLMKPGSTRHNKPKYQCNDCQRPLVNNPKSRTIPHDKKEIITNLFLERISLAGLARAVGVSNRWLPNYVNQKYQSLPLKVPVLDKNKGRLIIEAEEMHTYVSNQSKVQWLWLALEAKAREMVGVHLGTRGAVSAQKLFKSLPAVDRQGAVCYTDQLARYSVVFPKTRHRSAHQSLGKTNHIERLHNTFRQRLSRWTRKTLSGSKSLTNHLGAIWNLVHDYQAKLNPRSPR